MDLSAPANGAKITLASDSLSVPVPPELMIGEGAKFAAVAVKTANVSTSQTVRLTATYRGVTQTTMLTVVPTPTPALTSLTIAPTQTTGGLNVTGTLSLSEAAPAGGLDVPLLYSTAAVRVPTTLRVGVGMKSASFMFTTTAVNTTTVAQVTATLNGAQRTATLTVSPVVVVSPWRDYEIWIDGSITLEGRQVATKITWSLPSIMNWAHVNTTGDTSALMLLYAYFTGPSISGNSVTFSGINPLGYFQNLRGAGGGFLKSGTLTLTASGSSVGTTVTGNLEFSTETKTFTSAFTGRIVASDRIR
ncbi:MAG TPA: hypothetical protein VGK29_27510 [Paludibaculum sp.]|jgi:hypothetical protein